MSGLFLFSRLFIFLYFIYYSSAIQDCQQLLLGQYICDDPVIDVETQQPTTCSKDRSILLDCHVRPGLQCFNGSQATVVFQKRVENACRYGASVSHVSVMILSVFFGIFGADRFYLGHLTVGLFKLFSCGFFLLLYMADIVFITLELIGPANEESYYVQQYGSRVFAPQFDNESSLFLFNCIDCT